MPAKAAGQSIYALAGTPLSRASPLPHLDRGVSGSWVLLSAQLSTVRTRFKPTPPNPCGSGLAREGGGSVDLCIGWHTAFASKPAPTFGSASVRWPYSARYISQYHKNSQHHQTPVGAGLPAIAVDQSIPHVTDPPPSRASPLPLLYLCLSDWPHSTVLGRGGLQVVRPVGHRKMLVRLARTADEAGVAVGR